MGFTATLSRWLEDHADELSAKNPSLTLQLFEDWLGCLIAGLHEASSVKLLESLRETSTSSGAPLDFSDLDRALIFGFASHCLEIDDSEFFSETHPSSVIFSSLLAGASPEVSFSALLKAARLGFFSLVPIGLRMNPSHYAAGWHGTGTLGALGATVAQGALRGFQRKKFQNSFGLVATLTSGLQCSFGSPAKYLNAGRAAQNGLLAARLSEKNLSAPLSAFEDPYGIIDVFSGSRIESSLPSPRELDLCFIKNKPYPVCHCLIPIIENFRSLIRNEKLDPRAVSEIRLNLSRYTKNILRFDRPENHFEAFFSAPYALLTSLFTPSLHIQNYFNLLPCPETYQNALDTFAVETDEALEFMDHRIEIHMKNGTKIEKYFSFDRAFSKQDRSFIREKFLIMTKPHLKNSAGLNELLEIFERQEDLPSVGGLKKLLRRTFDLPCI